MARDEEPLLARQDTDPSAAEEENLLGGERVQRNKHRGWKFWREVGLFTWAVIATLAVIILGVLFERQQSLNNQPPKPTGKRNLIMMVSDGMGPTSLSLTRSYKQYAEGLPWSSKLVLDSYLIGQSRTRSTSSLVTDSAAGATAFSCGQKSYNGAIAVLDDHSPCGTVLEAAKKAGYMTGLVVTTRITDATPACFASHVNQRSEEDRIAEQFIGDYPLGRVVDLFMGGGRCHFLSNSTTGSCRGDNKDIIAMAKQRGFSYAESRGDFDDLKGGESVDFPFLGLFANTDIPYEIDRRFDNHIYPSLDEMTQTALKALSDATKTSDKGFFLMVEGSRIDHAGHANDPAAQVYEVLAYDKAFASVVEFLEKDPTPGVMVSTSDHETGGLATARRKCSVTY
jgi:alkaline phosphatase